MSINKTIAFLAFSFLLIQLPSVSPGQEFQKDATWVPESANVIAMVRIQDLLNSELAKAEKWRSKQYHSFKSGAATLPTSVESMLLASQVDLEYLQPLWQVAVMKKKGEIDLDGVKKRAKQLALPAQFGSKPALCVRSDAYIVQVASNTLVAMEPANRQATARWLSKHDPNRTTVSPYLADAIKFANSSSHFIFAIDLDEAVDVNRIKIRLANSPLKIENLDAVCEAVASIKGVQMAIRVTDKINGAFKIDFKNNTSVLMPYAKEFLLTALDRNGYMVDDFKDWKVSTKPGAIVLEGTLSNEGFNQIASFVEHPLNKGIERAIEPNQDTGSSEAKMAETTKMYLDAIKDYAQEMQEKKGRSLEYKAKFLEKYAYQIDSLYSPGIDPIAADFGSNVSETFREMSATLRQQEYQRFSKQMKYGVQYENNAAAANNANNNNYDINNNYNGWNTGWNGYSARYGKYTTERVRDQKRIDNFTQKEAKMKLDVMRMDLTKKYTDTKARLADKYKTKF